MNIKACFIVAGILFSGNCLANNNNCAHQSRNAKAKITVAAPEEDQYDVHYVKLEINATNASTSISGHTTSKANVVAAAMPEYFFELSNQLIIDSAKINGQLLNVTQVSNVVNKIVLPAPLSQNTLFTAEVFYHGAPTGGTGFFTNGILNQTNASIPAQVTHTVSAAIHSRDWWPCKQSLTDKIDSADIWITVPMGLKVASNGLLKNITPVTSGFDRYEWTTRYPVDYYLLSFSVAPYNEYNYYVHFSGSNDSMLVQNFIYDHPSVLQQSQDELDSIGHMINHFSTIFSKYPFSKEKFGICQTPLGGGMENQTMASLGSLDATLIAHELSHQWWGDNVTCASLKDMWLNEGFATYSEQLFVEHFRSPAQALSLRTSVFNQVMTSIGGSVYVDDTTNEWRIYDGRLTYYKGAAVAHMLRYMINNDSVYFQLLKNYQQQYAYSTATTEDLKNLANQISGLSLDTFFQQWIYKEGYPTYSAKWFQNGNQVLLKLSHTASKPLSVPVFKLPVEVKLSSGQGDTIIRVYNDQPSQFYFLNWNNAMTGLTIDPNNHILNKLGSITKDSSLLGLNSLEQNKQEIFPNPSSTEWRIKNIPINSNISLVDASGKKLISMITASDSISIPCGNLPSGVYVLTIVDVNNRTMNYHLMR